MGESCCHEPIGPSQQQRIDGMGSDPAWNDAIASVATWQTDGESRLKDALIEESFRHERFESGACKCGELIDTLSARALEWHRITALMSLILEHAAAKNAEAWDEGFEASAGWSLNWPSDPPANPYQPR